MTEAATDEKSRRGERNAKRLPPWFTVRLTAGERLANVRSIVRENRLHTVCGSAACPNRNECWNAGTATFLILGNICTRGCGFCNVAKGRPEGLDGDEPVRVARAVKMMNLQYAVVTSVTRDDLPDGGASIFAETIRLIRSSVPGCRVEVLIPDFQGSGASLKTVLDAQPDVLNHNLETVPSLYPMARPQADYLRSLGLLGRAKEQGATTKTGLMLGLGEGVEELRMVLRDLRGIGCDILTLGQYLRPGKLHLPVSKYYHPDEFSAIRDEAMAMGFSHVMAGPLVRSSYHAGDYGVQDRRQEWK
ncbi:MAG TPA: lipoyl synthase [Nitrospirota bacterium]